jgi:V8-like Glu-specific endopeptidase
MKPIRRSGPRIVIAAIALVVAVVAYADAQGSDVSGTTASERRATEAEISRAHIVSRLETALGDTFGGAWFEPSTGELRVGVTSSASRSAAAAVAEQAGVGEIVEEITVASTWAEIRAAQSRWADRLAGLFDRAEVQTALRAQRNAVEVRLGSSVPQWRRAELEQAAAADRVDVLIVTSDREHLRVTDQLQCKAFTPSAAYCDPTLVAGVTIVHENETTSPCTAGPTALPKDASTGTKATERFVLTAGHCINTGKNKWFSWDKVPTKLEIGPGSTYVSSHVADIGAIKINSTSKWLQAGFIPVKPTIAQWNPKAETTPIPVVSQQEPTENAETCISGQTSGKLCGKILATGVTTANKSNLAEVNVTTQGGDSGAPWYSKSYAESPGVGLVEGTHVGLNGKNAAFQPIGIGLEKLKAAGLDLELLTQNNEERRHPAFTGKKYPLTASASDASSEDVFTAFGATVSCTENEYHGEAAKAETFVEMLPTYKKCTGPLGVPVVATSNGCKYKFGLKSEVGAGSFSAGVDVVCPAGKPGIQFDVYSSHTNLTSGTLMCTLTVPPQTGIGTVTMTNSGEKVVVDKGTIEAVKVKIHRFNLFSCPGSGTEAETIGVYHNDAVTVSGTSGAEAVAIDIGGA